MKNVLFVCSQNRLRSPTAEQVFASRPDLEVASAGTNNGADTPLTSELVTWADVIVVMKKTHREHRVEINVYNDDTQRPNINRCRLTKKVRLRFVRRVLLVGRYLSAWRARTYFEY